MITITGNPTPAEIAAVTAILAASARGTTPSDPRYEQGTARGTTPSDQPDRSSRRDPRRTGWSAVWTQSTRRSSEVELNTV